MFIRSSVLITHTSMVISKKKNKTKNPPKKTASWKPKSEPNKTNRPKPNRPDKWGYFGIQE